MKSSSVEQWRQSRASKRRRLSRTPRACPWLVYNFYPFLTHILESVFDHDVRRQGVPFSRMRSRRVNCGQNLIGYSNMPALLYAGKCIWGHNLISCFHYAQWYTLYSYIMFSTVCPTHTNETCLRKFFLITSN